MRILFKFVSDPEDEDQCLIESLLRLILISIILKYVLNNSWTHLKQCIQVHRLIKRITQHLEHLVLYIDILQLYENNIQLLVGVIPGKLDAVLVDIAKTINHLPYIESALFSIDP